MVINEYVYQKHNSFSLRIIGSDHFPPNTLNNRLHINLILLFILCLFFIIALFASSTEMSMAKTKTKITGFKTTYNQEKTIKATVTITPANGRLAFLAYYNKYSKKWIRIKKYKLTKKRIAKVKITFPSDWRVFNCSYWRLRVPANKKHKQGVLKTTIYNDIIKAPSAAVYDVTSKKFIYAKKATDKRGIDSLAKLMTAVLLVEKCSPSDLISVEQEYNSGIRMNLKYGDTFSYNTALAGMLLSSANDCALNSGIHIVKKEFPNASNEFACSRFNAAMNKRAASLGMNNTEYSTPYGGPSKSTATDQIKLMSYVMTDKRMQPIRTMLGYIKYDGAVNGEPVELFSRNELIGSKYSIGGKTGRYRFYQFVNCWIYKNKKYISIVLGCNTNTDRWEDTTKLYEHTEKAIRNNYRQIVIP